METSDEDLTLSRSDKVFGIGLLLFIVLATVNFFGFTHFATKGAPAEEAVLKRIDDLERAERLAPRYCSFCYGRGEVDHVEERWAPGGFHATIRTPSRCCSCEGSGVARSSQVKREVAFIGLNPAPLILRCGDGQPVPMPAVTAPSPGSITIK